MYSSAVSANECKTILLNYLKSANFKIISHQLSRISDDTLGYLGEHLFLSIFYKNSDNSNTEEEATFFVKCLPFKNEEQKEMIESLGAIKKEVKIYKELLIKLNSLVSSPFCPEFYYGRDDLLVIENLKNKSYNIYDNRYLDLNEIKNSLRMIARMHAASIIYEEQRSKTNDTYKIINDFEKELSTFKFDFTPGHPSCLWYQAGSKCVAELCECYVKNENIKSKILEYVKDQMPKSTLPSEKYRNVMIHCDLWINNLMFNDKKECLLVDFQMTRYTPPAFDILLFLYLNAERTFLTKNFKFLINYYYESVEYELKLQNLDCEKVFSKNLFLESIEDYIKSAMIEAAVAGTSIFLSKEFIKNMMANKRVYEDFNYGNRVIYVLEEISKKKEFEYRFCNILVPLCKLFE